MTCFASRRSKIRKRSWISNVSGEDVTELGTDYLIWEVEDASYGLLITIHIAVKRGSVQLMRESVICRGQVGVLINIRCNITHAKIPGQVTLPFFRVAPSQSETRPITLRTSLQASTLLTRTPFILNAEVSLLQQGRVFTRKAM